MKKANLLQFKSKLRKNERFFNNMLCSIFLENMKDSLTIFHVLLLYCLFFFAVRMFLIFLFADPSFCAIEHYSRFYLSAGL